MSSKSWVILGIFGVAALFLIALGAGLVVVFLQKHSADPQQAATIGNVPPDYVVPRASVPDRAIRPSEASAAGKWRAAHAITKLALLADYPNPRIDPSSLTDIQVENLQLQHEQWLRSKVGQTIADEVMEFNDATVQDGAEMGADFRLKKELWLSFTLKPSGIDVNVIYPADEEHTKYWSRIDKGAEFRVNGTVAEVTLMDGLGSFDAPGEYWSRTTSLLSARGEPSVYMTLRDVKFLSGSSSPPSSGSPH